MALACSAAAFTTSTFSNDWPQWRGSHRDGKVTGFNAPATWPAELAQKWKVTVGDGVATPALVDGKLYVFSRQEGNEVLRCLDAANGKELWQDRYESLGASGPASGFSGPRSSPSVGEGKVVTIGVRGVISCLDAASGKLVWRKDEFKSYPRFHPSSSPIIMDGLCIAQLGGGNDGGIVAYDLATGAEKWKWTGGSPAYASPVIASVGGEMLIIANTETSMVAVDAATGKLEWDSSAGSQGGGRGGRGGRDYKAATPIVNGETVISVGSGFKALKLERTGGALAAKELWNNAESSVQFNTPVLKNGYLFGLTPGNDLFCINAATGESAWTAPIAKASGESEAGGGGSGGRRGGRGGGGGYGSIVDAGSVLLALTPSAELVIFEPTEKAFHEVGRIKVAASPTHAHPVLAGNGIYIKDQDSVSFLTIN